jgi:hypothetical protein
VRIAVIDGFRGIFLIFMLVIHANEVLKTTVGKLNHHYFGWVEDAQGFVFMSGLVVGLVYGGRYLRNGYESMREAIWARIRTIYLHQIFLILLFLVAALIFVQLNMNPPRILLAFEEDPILFPALSALLVTGSTHMGILPMYIFFMIATPFALRLLKDQSYLTYVAGIAGCWALAQTRVLDHLVAIVENFLAGTGHSISLGIFFNVLGWQAIFFSGLLIGFLMASKRLKTDFLTSGDMRVVFHICLALFFFYGIYDRIVFDDWFGKAFSEDIKSETDRGNFSFIYPMTFLVDLLIVVWLLGPGLTDQNRLIRSAAKFIQWCITLRPLVFLGQHSLHVFSAHIVIVYVLAALYQDGRPSELIGTVLIFFSIMLLYLVAWLNARSINQKKASSAPVLK